MNADGSYQLPSLEEIANWSAEERAVVAQSLSIAHDVDAPPPPTKRRRFILAATAVAAVVLIPWIFYLSTTLRDRHRVTMWNTAWIGFDVLLLLSFAASALAVWKRRLVAIPLLAGTAVLLLVDAWFDVTMSWGTREQQTSILTAMFLELPLFVVLVLTIRMSLLRLSGTITRLRGDGPQSRSVLARRMPVPADRRDD